MTQYNGSERARREKELRQRQFATRQQNKNSVKSARNNSNNDSISILEFSEWRMRRIAPIAMIIFTFTILFFISWIVTTGKDKITSTSMNFNGNSIGKIEVFNDEGLYRFESYQVFSAGVAPLYSELEIEILDENWDHVYSFYKDLWQERYSNGEGGNPIYHDREMAFEVELPKAGIYYIRPISHNNNLGDVNLTVYSRSGGSMYFSYYSIIFGALSAILILGSGAWGNPFDMYYALPKIMNWKRNKLFKRIALTCIIIFAGTWFAAVTHYGYPAGGDETVLPTFFYRTNNVTYLG